MKQILFLSSVIIGSLLLAGCQSQPTSQLTTPPAVNNPTPAPVQQVVDPEIESIEKEFTKLNLDTDLPAFTEDGLEE